MTGAQLLDGTSDHYLIRGGLAGRRRLRVLARIMSGAVERPRLEGRRAALVSFVLRFDLVREEHLALLPSAREPSG